MVHIVIDSNTATPNKNSFALMLSKGGLVPKYSCHIKKKIIHVICLLGVVFLKIDFIDALCVIALY